MARLDGQDGFQKIVALKSVLEQLGKDKRFLQMFLDEARICARLVHPNVCQVFELDKAEGIHYLAIVRSAQDRALHKIVRSELVCAPRRCEQAGTGLRVG